MEDSTSLIYSDDYGMTMFELRKKHMLHYVIKKIFFEHREMIFVLDGGKSKKS
jgi:hypothetical protein